MFEFIEKHSLWMAICIFATISVGGLVEIVPSFTEESRPIVGLKPYTPLQLAGRQIYIREGCNNCHSQLVRPLKADTARFGIYSKSGEYAYDRPFLWGSRRIGPDLMRVGNYRSTSWHEVHFEDVQITSPGSVMPNYKWFFEYETDLETAYAEAVTVRDVFGTPYDQPDMPKLGSFAETKQLAIQEAQTIITEMRNESVKNSLANGEIKEIIAIIAYLNVLK